MLHLLVDSASPKKIVHDGQKSQKVLQIQKKALPLHSLNENVEQNGLVAQLNRASDYGSEGYRFESCRDHKKELKRVPFLF